MDMIPSCPGRVVDILEASGALDPGSSPGRGVPFSGWNFSGEIRISITCKLFE